MYADTFALTHAKLPVIFTKLTAGLGIDPPLLLPVVQIKLYTGNQSESVVGFSTRLA